MGNDIGKCVCERLDSMLWEDNKLVKQLGFMGN